MTAEAPVATPDVDLAPAIPTGLTPEALAEVTAELAALAPRLDAAGDAVGEAMTLLGRHGLIGYMVPKHLGGLGGDLPGLLAVAEALGGACVAVAVAWVMHSQQVVVIDQYAPEPLRERVLRAVAERRLFIGSVTTEPRKGGHMLTAMAAMTVEDGSVRFRREAPVVTGGGHAGAFLVTVRRSPDSAPDDVVLVYCERANAGAEVLGEVEMMGMRAAGNVAMRLDVAVPADQVIEPPGGLFRITMLTMAPVGHLGWAACWVGAVRQLLRLLVRDLRSRRPAAVRTDAVHAGLARVRGRLDMAEALVSMAAAEYRRRESGLESAGFQILVNNVKVMVAEQTFIAVNELMEAAGMERGYCRGGPIPVERAFRDLRAASLMYGNERLLQASGRLALMDRAVSSFTRQGLATGLAASSSPGGLS